MTTMIAAYRDTDYWVDDGPHRFVLRLGEKSLAMAGLPLGAAFITAWNPESALTQPNANAVANKRLFAALQAAGADPILNGYGQSRSASWPREDSFLACGLRRPQAVEIGAVFDQNAIVWIGADGVPALVLLKDVP